MSWNSVGFRVPRPKKAAAGAQGPLAQPCARLTAQHVLRALRSCSKHFLEGTPDVTRTRKQRFLKDLQSKGLNSGGLPARHAHRGFREPGHAASGPHVSWRLIGPEGTRRRGF